ncbi:MAG: hypothetical protein ACI9G1_001243, partial [Pirellulaceae bacterium]
EFALSESLEAIGVSAEVKNCGCWSPVTHPEQLFRCWNDLFGLDLAATTRMMLQQQEALQRDADRVKPKMKTLTNTVAAPKGVARSMSRSRDLPTVNQ